MFTQDQISAAVDNAIAGNFTSDWNYSNGWNYASNSVVYSTGSDYLRLETDGWRDTDRRKVVIKNMQGRAILSLI